MSPNSWEGYPPPGTSIADIVRNYPWALSAGLYTNAINDCPPPALAALVEPTFPGYQRISLAQLGQLEVPPGTNLTARRFAARFPLSAGMTTVTIIGWYAYAQLNDGSSVVVLVRPFPAPLLLAPPMVALYLQPNLAVAPGAGAGGFDVLASATLQFHTEGVRMANVFRGEERRALKSLRAILNKIDDWDLNLANLPKQTKLATVPMLLGVPTTLVRDVGPPVVYYPGDQCAKEVILQLVADLDMRAPSTPP